jgi:hypothetical protein
MTPRKILALILAGSRNVRFKFLKLVEARGLKLEEK